MAIFSDSAPNPQSVYPEYAVDGQDDVRVEPLLTPEKFTERFLFGIPLVSQVRNPLTNKPDIKTPDALKDHLLRAKDVVEQQLGINITPIQREEPHPYDRVHMDQYGYFRTRRRPILSVDAIEIRPANNVIGTTIYTLPKEWISLTQGNKGQINIVPVVAATSQVFAQVATSNGAAFLLSFIRQLPWAPSYWVIRYTAGFPEGRVPIWVNELVGLQACMDVLNDLGATFRISSYSVGIDSISQSQTTPGPNIYAVKIKAMQEKYDKIFKKAKALYGIKIAASTI